MCVSGREKKRRTLPSTPRSGDVAGQGRGRQRGGVLLKIEKPRDVLCETWATLLSGRDQRHGVREFAGKASAGEASLDEEKQTCAAKGEGICRIRWLIADYIQRRTPA